MKRSKTNSTTLRSIYDEYFEYNTTYNTKYGNKTCVLLEVGSFFEIYTYKTVSTGTIQHPHTQDISRICNLSLVEKKATYKTDDQQIMMMGFRNYMLDKYLQKLVEADFIVVVFIQEKNGKDVTRVFDAVYSRGTFMRYDEDDNSSNTQHTHIVCIWLELLINKKGRIKNINNSTTNIVYGISAINIFTGQTSIFEYETPFLMNPTTFDEMERFLSTFPPSEVIFISKTIEKQTIQTILRFAGVQCNTIHIISKEMIINEVTSMPTSTQWLPTLTNTDTFQQTSISSKITNCEKQTYIQNILSSYYDNTSIYFQNNDFQINPIATQSFCYLLDFIKEHNVNLIRKLAIPVFTNTSNRMVLANHTLRQLNIINDNTTEGGRGFFSSVLSFTNRCCTAIGKRFFQRKLLNPTFDVKWLETEYAKIATILELYQPEQITEIRKKLSGIRDIEKIYRQVVLHKIYPSSIYQLYNSICILQELHVFFKETGADDNLFITSDQFVNSFENFKEFINTNFYINVCRDINSVQSFDTNIIKPGISEEIDDLLLKKQEYSNQLKAIYEYFNQLIRSSQNVKEKVTYSGGGTTSQTEYIKIHETEKSGVSFQLTATRAVALKKILSLMTDEYITFHTLTNNSFKISFKDIRIVASGSVSEIQAPFITLLTQNILKTEESLNIEISKTFFSIIKKIEDYWSSSISQYIDYTGNIDVLFSKAFIAREYGYCRPLIDNSDETQKSFLKATKMRHCLIEHLQTNEIYVPNDVILGTEGEYGILLFGTNAIGKTSLIRSIGVCVVLAQAGLYVPCESFIYKPYTALFSRIIGNDNLFKNLSTFQVEISELAVILKQADSNSLILGDEICSSTEMESGLSIIMASLTEFHNRRASFIFATHFHEIVKWEEMKQLPNIKIKHLEVSFDQISGKLIYDRKLKDGIGITSYGLTVCQSMNLPTDFLDNAFEIRNRHYPENGGILTFAQSKYNSKKLVGICEKCKITFSTEIHHIEPQKKANSLGIIQTDEGRIFHKNHPANLSSLCETCHKNEHI